MASHEAIKAYEQAQWGNPATWTMEILDPALPDEMAVMGQLVAFSYEDDGDYEVRFGAGNYLGFTVPLGKRSFCVPVLTEAKKRKNKRELWALEGTTYSLAEVAREAGGLRARDPLPALQVKVLGRCTEVFYKTHKKGHGPSTYVHEFGTEPSSEILPWLCVDSSGRLWLVGGNYWVEARGICG